MIRPLRQRHRLMTTALGALLPLAFVVGIAARKPVPVVTSVPWELTGPASDSSKVVWTKTDAWPGRNIITSLQRGTDGFMALELMLADLAKPDVLVYWVEGKQTSNSGLPENARLLGALSNREALAFPSEVRGKTGRLILYSLADQAVVAVSTDLVIEKE